MVPNEDPTAEQNQAAGEPQGAPASEAPTEASAPSPAPAAPVADPTEAPAEPSFFAEVDAWFVTHFHNLGVRLDTELFNAFNAAKDELKTILTPHLK